MITIFINWEPNSIKAEKIKNNYKSWKLEALDESGYFIIFQGFVENGLLNKISGNALKLYLYLGMNSNNFNGVVWHSNKRIAEFFGKSERTIRTWMKELEDLNLITRMRVHYDGMVYTYLKPYQYKSYKKNKLQVETTLSINSNGELLIKNYNENPITISNPIEIWDDFEKQWKAGRIEIRRTIDFFDDNTKDTIRYIFKSFDGFKYNLDEDKIFKIRIYEKEI